MAEQLAACARQLFEGASGSEAQRAANAWLMQFQGREEAWQAALQLLDQLPASDPIAHRELDAPQLVAMQILRLKTQHEWERLGAQQQRLVRQTLLRLLAITCVAEHGLSAVTCRIACVTLAAIVVKSGKSWTEWKSEVQKLVDAGFAAHRPHKAAIVMTSMLQLANVLGAIPIQILASETTWTTAKLQDVLTVFQAEAGDVMTAMQMILANVPHERSSALCCLESWIVGCIPTHETFGLTAAHLFSRGLLGELFNVVIGDNEGQAQLAAGVIADSFLCNVSDAGAESMAETVLYAGRRLVEALPILQLETRFPTGNITTKEQQMSACRGLSRIACCLAMHHATVLFSHRVADTPVLIRSPAPERQSFCISFLELLLACSSHEDIAVAQPTLEIWFFFLEPNASRNEMSWQLLDDAGKTHAVSVLSRLVHALIRQCKYPQWFIDKQEIVSDDPEIDAIVNLRREIADTLLSLFSKWPGRSGESAGDYSSCVKGVCQMLVDCTDVAAIDALFYLLSSTVELFDTGSSDSISGDDPSSFEAVASGGLGLLLGVLDCAANLPMHPLVVNGVARYFGSLSASLVLPPSAYLRASMIMCEGLQCAPAIPVAAQSLLHSSFSMTECTTIEDRTPLLRALLRFRTAHQLKTSQKSEGDLLEATFRVAYGLTDTDLGALCSSVLADFAVGVQSANPDEVSSSVYMLGRALAGVQDQQHGSVLADQLWPLVSPSLVQHSANSACRRAGVQFFLSVIPRLQTTSPPAIEAQMLDMCVWWYEKELAPDVLTCCSRLISRRRGNPGFQALLEHAFERLLAEFRVKLHDVKTSCGTLSVDSSLFHNRDTDKLIPEVEQFLNLTREVLNSFPQVLLQKRPNGEPTLYWICLDLATRLIKVDHQMQEIYDAACAFLLDVMRCQPEQIVERISTFAPEVVGVILSFLEPKRERHRTRSLWDFLFQCLHAPQIPMQIREGFLSAVSTVMSEGALSSFFAAEVCQQMPSELRMRCQRHRFRQYFSQLAQCVQVTSSS